MFFLSIFTVVACVLPLSLQAQETKKLRLDASKPLRLSYFSQAWNKNPNVVESGIILFRDADTGRIAKIEVTETEMNSGKFVGSYIISWSQGQEVTPEIYVVPARMKNDSDQNNRLEKMIKDGILLRKPYFLRPEDKKSVAITVFDSRDQAMKAFEEYRKQVQTKTSLDPAQGKNIVDPAALAAQEKARLAEEQKIQEEMALKAEADRKILAEIEAKKQEDLKKAQEALSVTERARRKQQAANFAEKALEQYKAADYKSAELNFEKAVALDPENKNFFYQYGVTLYKTENYNKSLVILDLADGRDYSPSEKQYYQALNYMKLKEPVPAAEKLKSVRDSQDKVLSPTASFLLGIIEFQTEDYEAAKKSFEYVLDQSSDPKLDEQAEAYIEQIANVMYYQKEREKKFILTFNLGLMYDSNILSVSNSQIDAGTPTDLEGFRSVYGGSIEYRPIYSDKHEFSALLSVNDMYSLSKNLRAEPAFQNTDPLSLSFALPYKFKGEAFSKPYQLGLTPSYETIQMNSDGNGARETLVNSLVLKIDQTFVMNENWFSNYLLELRSDDSQLTSSGDDDMTAKKISLGTTNTFFQDKKKTEAWIAELGLAQNMAEGKNQEYTRLDVAGSYLAPWKWDTSWTARLGLYLADYPNHSVGRKDTNTSLTLGLRKALTENLTGMLTGNYSINKSSLDSSDYKKYLIMTVFSWNSAF